MLRRDARAEAAHHHEALGHAEAGLAMLGLFDQPDGAFYEAYGSLGQAMTANSDLSSVVRPRPPAAVWRGYRPMVQRLTGDRDLNGRSQFNTMREHPLPSNAIVSAFEDRLFASVIGAVVYFRAGATFHIISRNQGWAFRRRLWRKRGRTAIVRRATRRRHRLWCAGASRRWSGLANARPKQQPQPRKPIIGRMSVWVHDVIADRRQQRFKDEGCSYYVAVQHGWR